MTNEEFSGSLSGNNLDPSVLIPGTAQGLNDITEDMNPTDALKQIGPDDLVYIGGKNSPCAAFTYAHNDATKLKIAEYTQWLKKVNTVLGTSKLLYEYRPFFPVDSQETEQTAQAQE